MDCEQPWYRSMDTDLEAVLIVPGRYFHVFVCVPAITNPCTGAGTLGRVVEAHVCFSENLVNHTFCCGAWARKLYGSPRSTSSLPSRLAL